MSEVRAAILDIDGTLLLSNDAHARAFVDAAAEMGIAVHFETVRALIGMGSDKLVPTAFGFEADSKPGEQLDELKGKIFSERYLPHIEPAPGARSLLERMKKEGLGLVVATSAGKEELKSLLDAAGVLDLIEDATSAGDVESSKPDPDVVIAALKTTGEPADAVVMIGDTPYDVEAASRAGVRIVALRCGGWTDAELRGAIAIYDDPEDLLAHYAESVFAE